MNEMSRIIAVPVEAWKAPITTAEFLRMCDADVFDEGKIELVDGELIRMPPPGNAHGMLQMVVVAQLLQLFGVERVRADVGIDLGSDTVLGCDGALLRAPLNRPGMVLPSDLLLVLEVSETTLRRDLGMKRGKYAAAGIPLYWAVDGKHSIVHVHAEPVDGEYIDVHTVRFGEPLTLPGTDAPITLQ